MNKGFTLVELIAVISILGILVIITTPVYGTISTNIKTRNYESKKTSIKKSVLSYSEKYLKDKIYNGTNNNCYYFSVKYLIHNGIISSDSESEEYIENTVTGDKYKENDLYIVVYYDTVNLKLVSSTRDDNNSCTCNNKVCDNKDSCSGF